MLDLIEGERAGDVCGLERCGSCLDYLVARLFAVIQEYPHLNNCSNRWGVRVLDQARTLGIMINHVSTSPSEQQLGTPEKKPRSRQR